MNLSLSSLVLSNIRENSPLFEGRGKQNFLIRCSKISRSFSPIFHTITPINSIFQKVYFSRFLSNVITISQDKQLIRVNYSSRTDFDNQNQIQIEFCSFSNCISLNQAGGALNIHRGNFSMSHCLFHGNRAKSSGSFEIGDCHCINISFISVEKSRAYRFGVGVVDGHNELDSSFISNSNFTNNQAEKCVGVIRIQHGSGLFKGSNFHNNTAPFSGCILTFTERPSFRSFYHCKFIENKANQQSAAITLYLMAFYGDANSCSFVNNENGSILVQSDSCSFDICECSFSGSEQKEIKIVFDTCDVSLDMGNIFNNTQT